VKNPGADKIVWIWVDIRKDAELLARDDLLLSFVVELPATGEVDGKDALGLTGWATDEFPTLEEIRSTQDDRFDKLGEDYGQT